MLKKIVLVTGAIISFVWTVTVCVLFVSLYFSDETEPIHDEITDPEYLFRIESKHFAINLGKADIQDNYRILSLEDFKIVKEIKDVKEVEVALSVNHKIFDKHTISLKDFEKDSLYRFYRIPEKAKNFESNVFIDMNEQDLKNSFFVDFRYCFKDGRCLTEKTDIIFND